MKIYTKTGDDGTTALFGAGRVRKDSRRIEAYGTVDELNATIGLARTSAGDNQMDALLETIQSSLFVLGADLATPRTVSGNVSVPRISQPDVEMLEHAIDENEKGLPELRNFILPAGTSLAAHLHVSRTVCRRAERLLVTLSSQEEIGPYDIMYLNRLSDLLFVLARRANHQAGLPDVEWKPRQE
jgi:cob(I)alamin adenosyltransferase